MSTPVQIPRLPTGVPGFDEVLGGGLPLLSFNLVAGGPGAGKTTLAHQFLFANANPDQRAIYFTVFGEPPIKMLRYQQQFGFFDSRKVGESIRFVHLGQTLMEGGLKEVLQRIGRELGSFEPRLVVVDSFRSLVRGGGGSPEHSGDRSWGNRDAGGPGGDQAGWRTSSSFLRSP